MGKTERDPSEILTDFLNYIDCCRAGYQAAQDAVRKEERRLQDLLHELEFAENENEKRRAATKLQQSRRERRKQKDEIYNCYFRSGRNNHGFRTGNYEFHPVCSKETGTPGAAGGSTSFLYRAASERTVSVCFWIIRRGGRGYGCHISGILRR